MALLALWHGVVVWWIDHFGDSHRIYSGKGGTDQLEHTIACHKEKYGKLPTAILFPPGELERMGVQEVCGVPLRESEEVPPRSFLPVNEV